MPARSVTSGLPIRSVSWLTAVLPAWCWPVSFRSWFDQLQRDDKKFAKEYLGLKSAKDAVWTTIRAAFASVSDTVIIPMQDYLELPGYARINTPSTLGGNWVWRLKKDALTEELGDKMKDFARIYRRLPQN